MLTCGVFLVLSLSCFAAKAYAAEDNSIYDIVVHADGQSMEEDLEQAETMDSMLMTTSEGQNMQCFMPKKKEIVDQADSKNSQMISFAKAAIIQLKKCFVYQGREIDWLYEICPGTVIRKKPFLHDRDGKHDLGSEEHNDILDQWQYKDEKLAEMSEYTFAIDEQSKTLVKQQTDMKLFTQLYGDRDDAKNSHTVQFVCQTNFETDDQIIAVQPSDQERHAPTNFLIASVVFCDPRYTNVHGDLTNLLTHFVRAISKSSTCLKKKDMVWLYEFCVNKQIRQVEYDQDENTKHDFSLGSYDEENQYHSSVQALVLEKIDKAHTSHRHPAFVQIYKQGDICKDDIGELLPRESRVLYLCRPKEKQFRILSVQEPHFCKYVISVATSAVCRHPFFFFPHEAELHNSGVIQCVPK